MKNQTKVERTSVCELVVTRLVNGPLNVVYEAWSNPDLFKKWWVPKSAPMTLASCEMDIRTGGGYRLRFVMGDRSMEFFGKYLEVIPNSRLVWTNEESGESAAVITTVTFKEMNDTTMVVVHDRYPSKQALDDALASEATGAFPEQFEQLDEVLAEKRN
jgi:uncharacterized protein YndB with AHSA1/START domain